ncbi:SbcC/MukB-like Walker B domain-containing protein [Streptosporangium sp. NPDC006013]|uniref:SbcC/MukB-like Walker B domain-containing protein n=1 Tax=Streptosporangium sp. NPDC006013 TaxID=3155596 RepID=UPI0033A66331
MTGSDHRAHSLSALENLSLGEPGVEGRWQPTRAGVVNSWAWAEETFFFGNGWLALAGPNGSGKSLTASMLVTVLLDADSSQTALSVSGKASGTLTSRHTDRSEREDRTGAWWLEYGLRDASTGETVFLTTGLWLRSTSSELQRAFFMAPGRVGAELILQRDREPVRVSDLSQQLVELGGELFTSSASLRPQATSVLSAVGDERDYRNAVRVRLFSPLDEVQFDALMAVVRSLRSVRTAEAISPTRMREVLTDALPALDPDQLKLIAEAMERIAELETQLGRARTESQLLDGTHRLYGRYLSAIAQLQAAELSAAHNVYDDQTRLAKAATEQLKSAEAAMASAETRLEAARRRETTLDGELSAAVSALRDHAGAELPLLEQRANELRQAATEAETRASQAETASATARDQAEQSEDLARAAQRHLQGLVQDLRHSSGSLGAEAVSGRLLTHLDLLVTSKLDAPPAVEELPLLSGTPLAWAVARTEQVRRVQDTLRDHAATQLVERTLADARRRAEEAEDEARDRADDASETRQGAESVLRDALASWSAGLTHLAVPSAEFLGPQKDSANECLSIDGLNGWLAAAVLTARSHIDLAGRTQEAATAAALAVQAEKVVAEARADHETALAVLVDAGQELEIVRETIQAEAEMDERRAVVAGSACDEVIAAGSARVSEAATRRSDGLVAALQSTRDWVDAVAAWRDSLVYLNPQTIALPDTGALSRAEDLDLIDIAAVRLSAHAAHAAASPGLQHQVIAAGERVRRITEEIDTLESELVEARRAAPVPPAPGWRGRRPDDGTPLWALVDFAAGTHPGDADRLEGALLVSGLLDALVMPSGEVVAGDLVITTLRPATGRTLADLLRPDSSAPFPEHMVWDVLRAIPMDSDRTDLPSGALTNGVLTALCPAGYRAGFIGRTARERARGEHVASLERRLSQLQTSQSDARRDLRAHELDVDAAAAERDSIPGAGSLVEARTRLKELTEQLAAAEADATRRTNEATLELQQYLAEIAANTVRRTTRLEKAEQDLRHTSSVVTSAERKVRETAERAAESTRRAAESETARAEAAQAQDEADAERASFPDGRVAEVAGAQEAEARADEDVTRARSAAVSAVEQHKAAGTAVQDALRTLNRAAKLPDGSLLPTVQNALDNHSAAIGLLTRSIDNCVAAAERCADLLGHSRRDRQTANTTADGQSRAAKEATASRLEAARARATVDKMRELHGVAYQDLTATWQKLSVQLAEAKEQVRKVGEERQQARDQALTAQHTLEGIAPQRESAERNRELCLRRLGRLAEEGLAEIPEDLQVDSAGRLANLTAGLAWARRLLADRPASTERLNALIQNRNRALTALENSVRIVSGELARFNRQVMLITVDDSEWRRAVIAEPDAVRGDDLHLALQSLRSSIDQLESDLREDVKQTLKTGMFTKLRQDIQVHREAARELVRQIRLTLLNVRTGVAKVGVQVDWDVKEDEDARRMIDLVTQPPSDETFAQMYTILRQRMDETVGEPWPDRVAHTFDYRAWHEWDISVTHSSFGDGSGEAFRKVSARSNPLESLSTGERRLATMLPLLAAAWSMYSSEQYRGPRLLSIDEIDAAFDEPNLRQVLGLLRAWDFDVLATTPSISPMIKNETGHAVVHEVVAAGRQRVTVPWVWEGQGEPHLLTFTEGGRA